MTLTVEPGIYFIDNLIEKSKTDDTRQFLNYEVIQQYRNEMGGIRIEDVLAISKDGYENYTQCPRTI